MGSILAVRFVAIFLRLSTATRQERPTVNPRPPTGRSDRADAPHAAVGRYATGSNRRHGLSGPRDARTHSVPVRTIYGHSGGQIRPIRSLQGYNYNLNRDSPSEDPKTHTHSAGLLVGVHVTRGDFGKLLVPPTRPGQLTDDAGHHIACVAL